MAKGSKKDVVKETAKEQEKQQAKQKETEQKNKNGDRKGVNSGNQLSTVVIIRPDSGDTDEFTKNHHGDKFGSSVAEKTKELEAIEAQPEYKIILKWRNIIVFIYLHIFSVYALFDPPQLWSTYMIQAFLIVAIGFGTTVGSHRLFTHRTYRAKPFLKFWLLFLQTMSGQEPVLRWVRDHRVHHKFTDTDADPHNSTRGFFFCHMGWLCCKKHPDVIKHGKKVDMSDLENDPWLQFQRKIYMPAAFILTFAIPVGLCYWLGEDPFRALNFNVLRYTLGLHGVWLVNSGAHKWGMRPYDESMSASETYIVSYIALGEGWHNYHHCFPWDYRTSEHQSYWFNSSTLFIDLAAWLGLATDLKTVPAEMIKKRVLRTGDGSHKYSKIASEDPELNSNNNNNSVNERDTEHFWGWGDKEMTAEDMKNVEILHKELD